MKTLDNNFDENKRMKNADLTLVHGDALKDGNPVIFAISPAKEGGDGRNYFQIYVAQQKENQQSEGLGAVQNLFLGWNSTLIVRAIANIDEEQYENNNDLKELIKVGASMDGFSLKAEESVMPYWQGQQPVGNERPDGFYAKMLAGDPVYRNYILVMGEEADEIFEGDNVTREKYEFDSVAATVKVVS